MKPRIATERVFVAGAGGHGKVVIDALLSIGHVEIAGVIDDDEQKLGQRVLGIPIVGPTAELSLLAAKYGVTGVALALGNNYIREHKFREVKSVGLSVLRVIHRSGLHFTIRVSGRRSCGTGGSVINPGSVLEDNVCVNTCASVDHDNHLKHSCHVFPNAALAGGVCIGECSYIGTGLLWYQTVGLADLLMSAQAPLSSKMSMRVSKLLVCRRAKLVSNQSDPYNQTARMATLRDHRVPARPKLS